MKFNPRYFLKLSTNLTFLLILLFGFGVVLWLIDEVLRWNILPDDIDVYLELTVAVFGLVGALALITMIVSLLALAGERIAEKTQYKDVSLSRKFKLRVLLGIGVFLLLNLGFHVVDKFRKERLEAEAVAEQANLDEERKQEKAIQAEKDRLKAAAIYAERTSLLDSSLTVHMQVLEPLLAASLVDLQSRQRELELIGLLRSLKLSIPRSPNIEVLTTAVQPYRYKILSAGGDSSLNTRQLLSFPSSDEEQLVQQVMAFGTSKLPLSDKTEKVFFQGEFPHSWKAIRKGDKVVGVIMVRK